ncbi:MAG TPA: hypothetical protein DCX46_09170 [Bacteroidetes bacterium]|nr:MAG: hypothetical protein A2X68_01540 [Ignavibacteria bacterium GWC2_56_12]HAV23646.1 hypothetical protein [Bacteroidota bacterium]
MATELLEQILPHVRKAIFPRRLPLLDWRMKVGNFPEAHLVGFKEKGWSDVRIPFDWGKNDRNIWFRSSIRIPEEFAGKTIALRLALPDALLYVNGAPLSGVDPQHCEVLLAHKARRNQDFLFAVEAYSDRSDRNHQFGTAELVEVNTTARALTNNLNSLHELEKLLEHGLPGLSEVRELIRRTLIFLKYFSPDGEEYPNAIVRALSFLQSTVATEYTEVRQGSIHLVGQSHLDVARLGRLQETIRKCGRSFSTAIRQLEEFPEYTYSQSQALLYDLAKRHFPPLYKEVRNYVSAGRWETAAATWVEPDCNIPSGESLVRHLLHGMRFLQSEFGQSTEVLWLPDSSGFPPSLPQIMKKAGINYFFTTKLLWNDTTTFPYSSFWWEGLDGSRILVHIPPQGLEARLTPKDLLKTAKAVEVDEDPAPVLQTFGYANGVGVTTEELDVAGVLSKTPGLVPSKLSGPAAFFKELAARSDTFPVWKKELYLEKHRGTYTTHGWIKRANREAERDLYVAEVLTVLRSTLPGASPAWTSDLSRAWKLLLQNQSHNIVTGTSIREAMDDARLDLNEVRKAASTVAAKAARGLLHAGTDTKGSHTFTAFNSLSYSRPTYIEVDVPNVSTGWSVHADDGTPLDFQLLERTKISCKLLVFLPDVPAFGFTSFTVKAAQESPVPSAGTWKMSQRFIETPRLRIRFDNRGGLSSVYDKSIRRELVQKGKRANTLQTFKDVPKEWEAWDLDADVERNKLAVLQFKGSKVVEAGPLRGTLRQEFRTASGTYIVQHIRLFHKTSRVDFESSVRWREHQTLLKAAFPLSVRPPNATYETQFGVVSRPTRSKVPEDKAKFEVPTQRWASLSDGKYGGAVVNDGKYGYDCRDNALRITLLRSPRFPHPIDPRHMTAPETTDQEDHLFTYSLVPFAGDWRSANVTATARGINVPVQVYSGTPLKAQESIFTLNRANIHCTALKISEDGAGVIVRLYEAHGRSTDASIAFGHKPLLVSECDLIERDIKPLPLKGARLGLKFKPFEIKTLRLTLTGKHK